MKSLFRTFLVAVVIVSTTGCEDLLEKEPPNSLLPSQAIQSEDDLQEVLISAYDVLANTYNGNAQNMANLLSDHVARPVADARYESIWTRSSTIFNTYSNQTFTDWYIANLRANTVLDNLDRIELTENTRSRVIGEASFIRALTHFDVVRLYAQPYGFSSDNSHPGVAIRTTSEVTADAVIDRSTVAEVYNFVLDNINTAKENLPLQNGNYATYYSAVALEAVVRFQMQDYQEAHALSSEIIESNEFPFDNDTIVNKYTFPDVTTEAIFFINTAELPGGGFDSRNGGFRGQWNSQGNVPNLQITEEFYDEITQSGGPRAELYEEVNQDGNLFWVTNMFNSTNFQIPIFTTTQMMLIRAESAVKLGLPLDQAISDINRIRERAYGTASQNLIGAASPETVLEAARRTMWFEFPFNGQRLHDLKRRGAEGEDIIIRGARWDCPGMLIQFPATEATSAFPLNPGGGC